MMNVQFIHLYKEYSWKESCLLSVLSVVFVQIAQLFVYENVFLILISLNKGISTHSVCGFLLASSK